MWVCRTVLRAHGRFVVDNEVKPESVYVECFPLALCSATWVQERSWWTAGSKQDWVLVCDYNKEWGKGVEGASR